MKVEGRRSKVEGSPNSEGRCSKRCPLVLNHEIHESSFGTPPRNFVCLVYFVVAALFASLRTIRIMVAPCGLTSDFGLRPSFDLRPSTFDLS